MKLAIASTTFLFAMMAAQATVLSAKSNTGVNLAKRAPSGDDETGQGPTVDRSSSVPARQTSLTKLEKSRVKKLHVSVRNRVDELEHLIKYRQALVSETKNLIDRTKQGYEKKASSASPSARAEIAGFEKILAEAEEILPEFEQRLEAAMKEYKEKTDLYLDLNQAKHKKNYGLLRQYLQNQ
ncbi:hypothetical protein BASA50_001175 [Batrachochytrium salamandrivorans]|uniref:Uncharacterized protein n=1 Tax=Batrachochytrium salamandrivorans TaxID=1357716 RepID=A0ABQ8ERV5_9FUNG|nr:hypothetical protein BASA60_008847 [Batrachochytrium salamandrivorans]KAH6585566.1 hypothetical protein BASA50_001175 [Batrachochytrium salamandrivorans]KAH9271361.1 hypothetical protein BASA83_006452 [Batrachochytrium salamandrivorans]